MDNFITQLRHELAETKSLILLAQKDLSKAPTGSLRCKEKVRGEHRYPEFYHYLPQYAAAHPDGRYLKKSEQTLIQMLAQKEYCEQLIPRLEERAQKLSELINLYPKTDSLNVYNSIIARKRKYISTYEKSDEEIIEQWYSSHPSMQNTYPTETSYKTNRGELVRSKTEKIIADKIYAAGIPYVYESKLVIGGKTYYPDFILLDVISKKTIYWEHFGMLENPQYAVGMMSKIDDYRRADILFGSNLIATFESQSHPINLDVVDAMIAMLPSGHTM